MIQQVRGNTSPSGHYWPAPLGAPQHDWEPPRVTTRRKNRSNRLKALGNAIVPQVAYEIICSIVETT